MFDLKNILDKITREIAWGPLLDLENESRGKTFCSSSMEKHLEVNTELLFMDFDQTKSETVKNYLSDIYDQQIKS